MLINEFVLLRFFGCKVCIWFEEIKFIDDEVLKKEIKLSKVGKIGKEKKIKF